MDHEKRMATVGVVHLPVDNSCERYRSPGICGKQEAEQTRETNGPLQKMP